MSYFCPNLLKYLKNSIEKPLVILTGHILDIWSQFEEFFTTFLFIVLVAFSSYALGVQ